MIEIVHNIDANGNQSYISSEAIRFVVSPCSSYESDRLWRESLDKGIDFISAKVGVGHTVDYVLFAGSKLPIQVTPFVHTLNGFPIVFIQPFGDAFVHSIVEGWIDQHFPCRWDSRNRRAICDPSNFRHCCLAIAEFQAEQRVI